MKDKKHRHECKEWDFMEIDEDSPEFELCLCFDEINLMRNQNNEGGQ